MANEFKHFSIGGELTQAEYEAVGGHVLESQAIGDIIYATSTSQLSRLGIGSTGAVLTVTGGVPAWDTTWTPTGHLIPAADDSYDLGSSAAAWQDLFLEGDISLTDAGSISTAAGALTIGSAAAINITPTAGSAILLDGTISIDAGVVTGATSITSTAFVGDITGNADTATALATTRAINGVNFDGSAAITVTAAAGTLSGDTLKSTVLTSSLTTVGALNAGSITSGFTSIDVGAGAITTTGALSIASMGTNWTNAGRTVADMGTVTTIDINGGTINGITDLAVVDGGTGASTLNNLITMGTHTTGNYVATVTAGTGLTSDGATSGESVTHSLSVDASQGQITTVGALASGSIADGFGTINNGSNTITTTGLVTAGSLTVSGTTTLNGALVLGDAAGDTLDITASATVSTDFKFADDIDISLGSNADILMRNRSTAAAANLEITDIILGTSVHPGVAANSLLVSNITANGDMMFATNRGGNTEAHMLFDASAGDTFLYARGVQAMKITGGGAIVVTPSITANGGVVGDLTGDVTGNADTVTTNANLTGMITSSGNTASLGAFTLAQLNTAISDDTLGGGGADMVSTNNLSDLANAGTSRTNLGVAIGSNVQAYSAVLDAVTAGTDLTVAQGGTGASTLTDHGVVLGSGSGAVSVTDAGSSGEVLISGGSGADPDWGAATDTTYTAGALLDLSGTEFAVDLSELADGTAAIVGSADELVYLDAGVQKRKLISEITLSDFNNDSGWTTNTGDITSIVAGTGLSGSSLTSGAATLNVDASLGHVTTVGTIGTGVWQGTAIASGYIAADAITGAKIANDAVNSEHYATGSIDTGHIANDQITNALMADDAIGVAQLSATGTAGSGTYLRGDNAWAAVSAGATIVTGTYTGNGATNLAISGLGFAPKYVGVAAQQTSAGAANPYHWTTDTMVDDQTNGYGFIHSGAYAAVGYIRSLDSDGFSVGDQGADIHPNTNSQVYNYVAIG